MFFEGSEKKLEVVVSDLQLRDLPFRFWQKLVKLSNADVLSKISNDYFDAYLLSESSLFVQDHRFFMITCGQTSLSESAFFFIKNYRKHIQSVFYQRKNELLPELQPTTAETDIQRLKHLLNGQSVVLGETKGHFNHIFYYEATPNLIYEAPTFELLMYDITHQAQDIFTDPEKDHNIVKQSVRELFRETNLFCDFTINDFVFSPYGYSVNGLLNASFFTIHITPQKECSYASFESNLPLLEYDPLLLHKLFNAFKPKVCDALFLQSNQLSTSLSQPISTLLGQSYNVFFYPCLPSNTFNKIKILLTFSKRAIFI